MYLHIRNKTRALKFSMKHFARLLWYSRPFLHLRHVFARSRNTELIDLRAWKSKTRSALVYKLAEHKTGTM